jgi:hypothetical protein
LDKREQMEKIVGGKITPFDQEPLPGLESSADSEVVYFADRSGDIGDQMRQLARQVEPPLLKHGSVGATMHKLITPSGEVFHAIRYRGDIDGWRRQIEEGARALGVVLGRIEAGQFLALSTGQKFALSECTHERIAPK